MPGRQDFSGKSFLHLALFGVHQDVMQLLQFAFVAVVSS
jgi:hypothetical protein